MPTTAHMMLGTIPIRRAYSGSTRILDNTPAPLAYLGTVASRGDGAGYDVTLDADVAAGVSLLATVVTYAESPLAGNWQATDPGGNTWQCPVMTDGSAFPAVVVAILACQAGTALSSGDTISITAPTGANGAQYSILVDAFTGADATAPIDTTMATPGWATTSWDAGILTGAGLAYTAVGLYSTGSDITPGAGWTHAGGPVSGGADPRIAVAQWQESAGTVTVEGTPTPSTGTAVAAVVLPKAGEGAPPQQALPLWGAAVGGNSDPAPIEQPAGRSLGVRRTYYNASMVSEAESIATADVASGRVPWPSFKLPGTWVECARGDHDAWFADVASRLGSLGGPVMVTFHHEPDGDEPDLADFVAMHDRAYTFTRPYPNLRCGPVLTGWNVLFSGNPEFELDTMWPGGFHSGDFVGFDCYNYYKTYNQQGTFNASTGVWSPQPGDTIRDDPGLYVDQSAYYGPLATWAANKGTQWAIGEFGFSAGAADLDIANYGQVVWLQNAWDSAVSLGGCLALAYFDSAYHAVTDWRVEADPPRLGAYLSVLDQSPTWSPDWG